MLETDRQMHRQNSHR